ncbi:phage portal protein [Sinorhizobium medicae]|nr:phage portal protein [Sinorhizobium medicae]MDX0826903.1 phage portal protein [Sinorhizobium medicae]
MRFFGLNISRVRPNEEKALSPVYQGRRGWFSIMEPFTGAWQRNIEIKRDVVLSNPTDFACRTLIASDVAKLPIKLMERDKAGVWSETSNTAYSPVLRKPNNFQNRMQFMEAWVISKLQTGNTVILKQRDGRGVVKKLYVLDWGLVTPLVSESGAVFYQLSADNLAGIEQNVTVPASEIIHDRYNCFFHPLIGLSPIFAGGLAAIQGLAIQKDSTTFFQNGAQPGGILTAAGAISDETAERLKEHWDTNFAGDNSGKVAVLGDGLKYEPMKAKAVDTQLIEQLKWTAQTICSTYHVPPYKVGVGELPSYDNIQALNVEYYSQCLQVLIEAIELCLDEGLSTGENLGTQLDTDNLLRMDSVTQMEVLERAKSVMTLDERRKRLDLKGVTGGATIYLQQQDHSIEAIAARDKLLIQQANNPTPAPAPGPVPTPSPQDEAKRQEAEQRAFAAELALSFQKGIAA